ncbi:MAG: stage III sporulation protein AF [Clostridium sp.]
MDGLYHWVSNIVYYLIMITMIINLLPSGKYEKYLQLFAGCILILLVIQPVTRGLRLEEKMAAIFENLTFENRAEEIQADLDGMENRRMKELIKNYENVAAKDIERMISAKGFEVKEVSVKIGEDEDNLDFGKIKQINAILRNSPPGQENRIRIEVVTCSEKQSVSGVSAQGESTELKAFEQLEQEIAEYYQVEAQYVEIRLENE